MSDRAAQRWFDQAYARSPSGMLLLDARGNIQNLNTAAARLFGWHRHELAGCPVEVLVANASRRKLRMLHERYARGGNQRVQRADIELRGQHREGREFKVAVGVSILDGEDGPQALVSVADLSRRERTEYRIRSQNDALRDAVIARTAELEASNARLLAEVEERRRTERELRAAQKRLQEMNAELRRVALVDEVTGLANRHHFESRFHAEYQRAARSQTPLSIVLLDLDHFKAFNDHAGHPAGYECLRRVASAVASCLRRPADLVARFGGEELVALLPDTPRDGAAQIARAMREAVRALGIAHPGIEHGVVTVSAGVACLATASPESSSERPPPVSALSASSPRALLEAADRALYAAKARGRDRVCVAVPAADRALSTGQDAS